MECPPVGEGAVSGLGRGSNLATRIAVGVVTVPALALVAWVGGLAFVALVALIVALGLVEFYRMAEAKDGRPLVWLGVVGGVALCLAARLGAGSVLLTLWVGVVLVGTLFTRGRQEALAAVATTLAGLLWVGWLGSHLVLLRELPEVLGSDYRGGAAYVWLTFALTWSSDTAAYAAGTAWGRHRLLERVSPKKSVEGAVGGVCGCLLACAVAREWFAPFLAGRDVWVLGLAVGVVSQMGDFVESMVKRDAGVKDASSTIPGHGGVLDRFDSMLFSAPLVYLYLRHVVLS